MFKKVLFVLAFLFFVSPRVVSAQNVNDQLNITVREFQQYEEATRDCSTPSLECLVKNTTRFTAMEWTCNILGDQCPNVQLTPPPITPGQPSDSGAVTPVASQRGPGVVSGGFKLISLMYANPIASSGTYVADIMDNMGIAKPAYAQGLGFAALDPILGLWKIFRNIAYIFFVVVFLVIGFMIMFRSKTGSAAVSSQQAIPSIIVALITVTFSYAIAGFMIDLMYLTMFMIIGIFFDGSIPGLGAVNTEIINYNIWEIGTELIGTVTNTSGNTDLVSNFVQAALGDGSGSQAASTVFGFIGGLTLSLVMAVAVLIGIFKLFFELLKSYVMVTISVVISPIVLMMGAIPGHNPFGGWLKNIIGNLAAFPTVLLVLVMYYQFSSSTSSTAGFMPPFLAGGGQAGMIGPVMGFAIILAMPEIVKEVKKKLGVTEGGFGFIQGAAVGALNARMGRIPSGLSVGKGLLGGAAIGAGALARVPLYAALARRANRDSELGPSRAAWLGGAAGVLGARRSARLASKFMSKYGEFAENLPGIADDLEKGAAKRVKYKSPYLDVINYVRTRRRGEREKIPLPTSNGGQTGGGTNQQTSNQRSGQVQDPSSRGSGDDGDDPVS